MGDFDPKSLADLSRDYARLRRRGLLYSLGYVVPFVILMVLVFTASENTYPLVVAWFLLSVPLASFFMLASGLTGLDLRNLICPRYGERFVTYWGRVRWTYRCKRCGLDLGRTAIASKERPSVGDPLE